MWSFITTPRRGVLTGSAHRLIQAFPAQTEENWSRKCGPVSHRRQRSVSVWKSGAGRRRRPWRDPNWDFSDAPPPKATEELRLKTRRPLCLGLTGTRLEPQEPAGPSWVKGRLLVLDESNLSLLVTPPPFSLVTQAQLEKNRVHIHPGPGGHLRRTEVLETSWTRLEPLDQTSRTSRTRTGPGLDQQCPPVVLVLPEPRPKVAVVRDSLERCVLGRLHGNSKRDAEFLSDISSNLF